MSEMMNFPDTWEEYEKLYGFNDSEEIYTNNSMLIPQFRVKQWLDHIAQKETKQRAIKASDCIRRQDAKDAVDMVLDILDDVPQWLVDAFLNALNKVPSAEKVQLSGEDATFDCISRQAAIDSFETYAEMLRIVLDDTDVVGNDRDKFAWGLGLIESFIADMKELPSAEQDRHICRECKWIKFYANVDKNSNVESMWFCTNWDGGTDEEGFCHEWESK